MPNRFALRGLAAVVALGLLTAACGDDSPSSEASAASATSDAAGASGAAGEQHAPAADSSSADLRATLETALQEHVYLAGAATGAALAGRKAEFEAAAATLDANSVALSKAIGSVYGAPAEDAFLPLWRKHIEFFVQYTTALGAKDKAGQDKAVADLTQYAQEFGAFLSSANPNLPKATVAELVGSHVLSLKEAVDAQAAGDVKGAYTKLSAAAHHMTMVAEPLAAAIVKQFPEKFDA